MKQLSNMNTSTYKYIIGLTGNIACGKSSVVAELIKLGATAVDADSVTRELQQPGQTVYQSIVATFGPTVVLPDGQLNRKALAHIVFADAHQLRILESIVHPAVRQHILTWLAQLPEGTQSHPTIAVIDAIKLIESEWPAHCNAVWVVACDRAQQIDRLCRTRNMSESEAIQRIDAQNPQSAKIAVADVIINNTGTWDNTVTQIHHHWQAIIQQFRES
jgi:dephospho-CoA kinase